MRWVSEAISRSVALIAATSVSIASCACCRAEAMAFETPFSRRAAVSARCTASCCSPLSAGLARSARKPSCSAETASASEAPSPGAPCACSTWPTSRSRSAAPAAAARALSSRVTSAASTARPASPTRTPAGIPSAICAVRTIDFRV
jgi:hypothetical protein